jgi:hypothetical protein
MSFKVEVEIPDGVTHAYVYVQSARDLRLHGFTLVHVQKGIKLWKKEVPANAIAASVLAKSKKIFTG